MATIRDVARRAGVAISTASAALNRSAPVSEDVIAKVKEAVEALGYIPHGGAQSLRSGQSRLIGLIVPNISNPHFSAVARIVENVCLSSGFLSMAFSTGQDSDREQQILRMLRRQRVAGLIIIPTRSDAEHGRRLKSELHVPTVLLDMPVEGLDHDVLRLDNVEAVRQATDHLLALGHRRIAVLTGLAGLRTSIDRLAGYTGALEAAGVAVDDSLLLRGDFDQQVAFESTLAAMGGSVPPSAFLSLSNMMTMGMLHALKQLGLSIPDDVSVLGVDDFEVADLLNPPLSVVRVPVAAMAQRAIEMLLQTIAGEIVPSGRVELFHAELVPRSSTAEYRFEAVAQQSISI